MLKFSRSLALGVYTLHNTIQYNEKITLLNICTFPLTILPPVVVPTRFVVLNQVMAILIPLGLNAMLFGQYKDSSCRYDVNFSGGFYC